jgi:hypothetical protein
MIRKVTEIDIEVEPKAAGEPLDRLFRRRPALLREHI